ncbi:MAG: lytic transglycosylase domain-containing protein [Pseudomonadota bacterium]|nr:lytic transglycosylase domain-containing protein [Pseudomonadota bacterium]
MPNSLGNYFRAPKANFLLFMTTSFKTPGKQFPCLLIALFAVIFFSSVFPKSPETRPIIDLSKTQYQYYSSKLKKIQKHDWNRNRTQREKSYDILGDKIVAWLEMTQGSDGYSFEELSQFITKNDQWPGIHSIRKNLELKIQAERLSAQRIIEWFKKYPPLTVEGHEVLAKAFLEESQKTKALSNIKAAWLKGRFSRRSQKEFYKQYRNFLNPTLHWNRLDRLLWRGRTTEAQRMLRLVPYEKRAQAVARIKLRSLHGGVDKSISALSEADKKDPGIIYERIRWRRVKNKNLQTVELFNSYRRTALHPKLWATERIIIARRLMVRGEIGAAWKILRDHQISFSDDRLSYAKVQWLAGWLALRYLNNPAEAFARFMDLFEVVRYPVSKARAAYWLARSAETLGDSKLAEKWFTEASRHPTTFYGQLALQELPNATQSRIEPAVFDFPPSEKEIFYGSELVRSVQFLEKIGQHDLAKTFFKRVVKNGASPVIFFKAMHLAKLIKRVDLAVWLSRRAHREGLIFIDEGYPKVDVPRGPLEVSLLRAIIRQESDFNIRALSPRGAAGLMQLMPYTARAMASDTGLAFSRSRLTEDAHYNLEIGSSYLARLLNQFRGSYILALAAYNAGPGSVANWLRSFGDPRNDKVDPIDWIEKIPYLETRTYVQRVLGNLQIFRFREFGGKPSQNIKLDLFRGYGR